MLFGFFKDDLALFAYDYLATLTGTGSTAAVLPVGRCSRTIGLVFSLRCGKFFAVAGCGFLG